MLRLSSLPVFLLAGFVGLTTLACDEDLEITNTPATLVAAGNISGPVEGCPRMNSGTSTDAGTTDAGTTDAGLTDAGLTDAGTTDAGLSDTGVPDAGAQPAASGAMISRSDDSAVIPYLLRDPEGDDQSIKVELCQWDGQEASQCGVAVQGRGGDGSNFVPTTPAGACILHVFYWDVGCGRFVGTDNGGSPSRAMIESVDQQLVARVSVVGSDEAPMQTEPFSLEEIGFESLPACE
jgi:hypothetical protein